MPVEDVEEVDAVLLDLPILERQEVTVERPQVGRGAESPPLRVGGPFGERCRADAFVEAGVMLQDDAGYQPLDLGNGEAGVAGRIVDAPLLDGGEGGAGQEVQLLHEMADAPFDVAAHVRRSRRPVPHLDAVILAGPCEGLGVELLAVVDVDDLAQARDRPFGRKTARRQPVALVHHRVGDAGRHTGHAGRIEGQVEAAVHPGSDVHRQGDERAPDDLQRVGLHPHHVGRGMVDLDDLQGTFGFQRSTDRVEVLARLLGAVAPLGLLPLADDRQAGFDGLTGRPAQPFGGAPGVDALHQQ
ncbi:hypothetical protein [Roseomonas genomospecies 6]|uniref:hypothetical protein n=1 Tax=Roseomonas genomospecies 6 TaxID=214106 RepID=UPI002570E5B7|nr:hypothetical protein [Roseomonas genomospecies 6]